MRCGGRHFLCAFPGALLAENAILRMKLFGPTARWGRPKAIIFIHRSVYEITLRKPLMSVKLSSLIQSTLRKKTKWPTFSAVHTIARGFCWLGVHTNNSRDISSSRPARCTRETASAVAEQTNNIVPRRAVSSERFRGNRLRGNVRAAVWTRQT